MILKLTQVLKSFHFIATLTISMTLISSICTAQQFTRVHSGPVVSDGGASQGVSWVDYNNDGFLDIYITNMIYPAGHENFLYRNNHNGNFERIVSGEVCTDLGASRTGTWGDFDNDGDEDLFVTNLGSQYNCFYQNEGIGIFTKITTSIITQENSTSTAASWADYNNDGNLDLVVANYGKNFLFRNDGLSFTKIDQGIVADDSITSYCTIWGDYNNDGNADLYVTNTSDDSGLVNSLYKNNGDGTFSGLFGDPIVFDADRTPGASWGDYDNDGDIDLFVTNVTYQSTGNNYLFNNNGNGSFTKITEGNIVNDGGYSFGSAWGDYDNDGDLDLAVANYLIDNSGINYIYSNNGDGTFDRLASEQVATDSEGSVGVAWGDYDRDGDLDLLFANGYNDDENNALYKNNGNSNNWINLKLIGTQSNKSAIGAKIKAKAYIGGQLISQYREISGLTGYCSQNSKNVHFGLGDALLIDSLTIEWPSGIYQVFENVEANNFVTIKEGNILEFNDELKKINYPQDFILSQNFPNPFNPTTIIRYSITSKSKVTLKIFNPLGEVISVLVDEIKEAGDYEAIWNAEEFSTGVYFYRIQFDEVIEIKKMLLLK